MESNDLVVSEAMSDYMTVVSCFHEFLNYGRSRSQNKPLLVSQQIKCWYIFFQAWKKKKKHDLAQLSVNPEEMP